MNQRNVSDAFFEEVIAFFRKMQIVETRTEAGRTVKFVPSKVRPK